MSYLITLGLLIVGWAIGIYHSERMCAAQGSSLMQTLEADSPYKSEGSDLILKSQAASAFGLAWRIGLWIRPWKWGRVRPVEAERQAKGEQR